MNEAIIFTLYILQMSLLISHMGIIEYLSVIPDGQKRVSFLLNCMNVLQILLAYLLLVLPTQLVIDWSAFSMSIIIHGPKT